ncbi:MAG: M16 family metallopeptidase [Vicinamibacterales bacterium]
MAPVRHVLPNGGVVIVKQSRVTPAVTIHASVRAGSAFDPPSAGGLAHFVSKTIDRGTTTRSADDIADVLDSRGVTLAVAVNRQTISFVCTCLTEDVGEVLAVVADTVQRPAFPDDQVATRRQEILTLIRQDEDNPAAVAGQRLLALLYGEAHPYGRRVRGTADSVAAIDRPALEAFHRARFSPSSLSLVMVGDLEAERAIDLAGSAFGGWSGGATPAATLPPVARAAARRTAVVPMMNKSQADIAYGFVAIARSDPAFHAYALMNNVLGEYALGGRLGDSIRERQGMAYYVFSGFDANAGPGPLTVRAGVNPANVERAVASMDNELKALATNGPTDKEVAESKQYLIGSMPRTLETHLGIAEFLQAVEFFDLGLDYDLRMPGLLRAVTRDEVAGAARSLLDPSRATVVVAGPYDGVLA